MRSKSVVLLMVCIAVVGSSFTSVNQGTYSGYTPGHQLIGPQEADLVDCTLNVSFELENGSKIEGQITISGVTLWQCTKMKVANFFSKIF